MGYDDDHQPARGSRTCRPIAIAMLALGVVLFGAPLARAHTPPPSYAAERPMLELSSWLGLGGGALSTATATRGLFDLRLGFDVTGALNDDGDLRIGPYVEVSSGTFSSFCATGGVELFLGGAPRPLRMFYYSGEGTLLVRLGAGWSWWHDVRDVVAPVASLTVAYGYRAPFSLREYSEETSEEPGQRATTRYMVGARLWANATVGFSSSALWQVTGGIEFEPVGTVRYLFGLY